MVLIIPKTLLALLHAATHLLNPFECKGNYSATSNDMKLVHSLMGGLLHLVGLQRGADWAGPQHTQTPSHCTICNSPPINGQCTSHRIPV